MFQNGGNDFGIKQMGSNIWDFFHVVLPNFLGNDEEGQDVGNGEVQSQQKVLFPHTPVTISCRSTTIR